MSWLKQVVFIKIGNELRGNSSLDQLGYVVEIRNRAIVAKQVGIKVSLFRISCADLRRVGTVQD